MNEIHSVVALYHAAEEENCLPKKNQKFGHYLLYELLEYVKGSDLQIQSHMQDLHDTGQHQDIQEESQWGLSIDRVAEVRGLEKNQQSIAKNTSKGEWTKECSL